MSFGKKKPNIERICESCGHEFFVWPSLAKIRACRFCSKKCQILGRNAREKRKCCICGADFIFRTNPSRIAEGKGKCCSRVCFFDYKKTLPRYKLSEEARQHMRDSQLKRVANGTHHLWKGGITKASALFRMQLPYRLWRESVFKRDDYTCQICFVRGVKLQADHIKQFAKFPELRLELSNGRTLCVECHKLTPTYLNGAYAK